MLFSSLVYDQGGFPVSGVEEGQGEGTLVGFKSCLFLSSVPITSSLLVGTGLPPNRPFVYMLFACFLSLRFRMLFTDPFPFYSRDHLFSPYLSVRGSLSASFISSGLSFSPQDMDTFFRIFLPFPG